MLLVNEIFDQVVARHFLPVHEIFHQAVLGEQRLHRFEMRLQFFCVGVFELVVHSDSSPASPHQ